MSGTKTRPADKPMPWRVAAAVALVVIGVLVVPVGGGLLAHLINREIDPELSRLAGALAWPAVVLLGLWILRPTFGALGAGLERALRSGRAIKLGVGQISVELGATTTTQPEPADINLPIASEPSTFVTSYRNHIEALIQGPPVEAATIDLGAGFLTSRLYVTARMMARQRDVRVFAFVGDDGVEEDQYHGACQVDDLVRALEVQFPEYAAGYALALHHSWWVRHTPGVVMQSGPWSLWPAPPAKVPQLGGRARLPAEDAATVLGAFLESMQHRVPAAPPPTEDGWVWLESARVLERAEWVTLEWLTKHVGARLMRARVLAGPSSTAYVTTARDAYVGLVDDAGRLQELIDRCRLLDKIQRARTPE